MLELTVSVLFSMAAHEQALSCSPQVEPAAQPELNITGPGGWPGTAGGAVIVGKKSSFTGSRGAFKWPLAPGPRQHGLH